MVQREGFIRGFSMALGAVVLALLLFVGWRLLQATMAIITPFVVAFVFALLLNPLVTRVERKWGRGKRGPAVGVVFLGFLLVFTALIGFLVPNLIAQTSRLVRFFSPITYRVERAPMDGGLWRPVASDLAATNYTVTKLDNGKSYQFRVVALDSDDNTFELPPVVATPSERSSDQRDADKDKDRQEPKPDATPAAVSTPAPIPPITDTTSEEPTMARPISMVASPAASPTPMPSPNPSAPSPTVPGTGTNLQKSPDNVTTAVMTIAPGTIAAFPGDREIRLVWKPPADVKSGFERLRADVDAWLLSHRKIGPITLPPNIATLQTQYSAQLSSALQEGSKRLAGAIAGSVSTLLTVIVIPIVTFYILNDIVRLRARFLMMLPIKTREQFLQTADDVGEVFGNYLRGMLTLAVLYGIVAMVVFFVLDLRGYALLLGFVAGIAYPVPYIGPLITSFLGAVVSLATGHPYTHALIVVGVIQVQNIIFDNFLVPRVVGKGVGLHPLTTVFALFLGSQLFGLWGMLLSVPIAASIQQVLYRLFPKLTEPTPVALMRPHARSDENETDDTTANSVDKAAPS
jgi:predicted PurR-regulated permease PerM